MGAEAKCRLQFNDSTATGLARLETDVLQFRGSGLKLTIPFKSIQKVVAIEGSLKVTAPDGTVEFELGPAASKWAEKIANPPSRLQKLGVKPGWRASAIAGPRSSGWRPSG